MASKSFSKVYDGLIAIVLVLVSFNSLAVEASTVSNLEDFNTVTDLTSRLNDDGTPAFSNQATGGINNTGSVNAPVGSDEIWTTKQGYSVTGNAGDVYTFSAYFKVATNSGYGNLGFTSTDSNTTASKGQPALGLGANFHGGGGGFFNDGSETTLSWPPDLVLGNWYWMTFEVTAQGSNTYDLKLQIWNTDSSGLIGAMKTEKTLNGIVNATLGSATTIHAFFGASGSRMDTIDDFKVELVGATFVGENQPVVIAGSPVDTITNTTAVAEGNVTDDRGFAITVRGTCWSTSPNPTTSDTCTSDGAGTGTFTSTMTGLTPGTKYYSRPFATNSNGTTYGPEESFTTTNTAPAEADTDGVSDSIESSAPNSGDANNDGTPDSQQNKVSSLLSPSSNKYVVLESNTCTSNNSVSIVKESADIVSDSDYSYPAGLIDFTLTGCSVGATESITEYYYGNYNLEDLVVRKYNSVTKTYSTVENAVITSTSINGEPVIKVVYQVTDGGPLDEDGVANGSIVDPTGLALGALTLADTGSSSIINNLIGLLIVFSTILLALKAKIQQSIEI